MNITRRLRLIAFFLPVVGLLLMMPPFVFLFDRPGTFIGVPVIIAFLFMLWGAMIVATFLVQRRLRAHASADDGAGGKSDIR